MSSKNESIDKNLFKGSTIQDTIFQRSSVWNQNEWTKFNLIFYRIIVKI